MKVAECFVCACWVVGGVPSFCLSILLHNKVILKSENSIPIWTASFQSPGNILKNNNLGLEDSSRHVVKSCFHFIAYPTQAKTCMEADSNSLPSSIISYPHCLWPCIQPLPAWESPPSVLLTSTWEAPSCQAHPAPGFPILWLFHLFRLKVQHLSPTHPLSIGLCRTSAKSFLLFLAFEFLPPAPHQTLASPLSPLQSDPQTGTQFEWLPWVVLDKFKLQPSASLQP